MPPSQRRHSIGPGAPSANGRLGTPLVLLLVWMFYEFGRPSDHLIFKVPLLISIVSVGLWLFRDEKQLGKTGTWWFGLLLGMVIMIPLAINNYAAYQSTRTLAILVLTICLPLQSVLKRVTDVRAWVYSFLAVATYVGVWATMTGGYGRGGQDENYAAALMGMALPLSYFSLTTEKRRTVRILFGASIVVFIAAVALADNASRGGFLALCAVGFYIIVRSPRKKVAIGALAVAAVTLLIVAGPAFWAEIRTTDDFETGTGDLRLRAWRGGFRMFLAYPIFGVGPGNFTWQLGNFEAAADVASLGRSMGGAMVAHSMWVEGLADVGLWGMTCMLALLWSAWTGLEKVQRGADLMSKEHPLVREFVELRGMAFAVQGAILATAVNGLFLSLFYYSHMWLLIVVGNAMPYVFDNLQRQHSSGTLVHRPAQRSGRKRIVSRATRPPHATGHRRRRS
jgi:O-antigen ligase